MAILLLFLIVGVCAASSQSLRGSPESLRRQNRVADRENLSRLTENQLAKFKRSGLLVPLPENQYVTVDPRLPKKYRYCRPWTRDFLLALGRKHFLLFGAPFQVNSAVRTVEYQGELRGRNGNAAPSHGPTRSSHLTGSTVDITKVGMSVAEIAWVRRNLLTSEEAGLVEATEEFNQSVFHVMVFRKRER